MFRLIYFVFILALLMSVSPTYAQTNVELPVYIVQQGDTVNLIAIRFGIAAQDIIDINQIENPNILSIGTRLKIPGMEGVRGTLITEAADLGASLITLSRKYQIPPDLLVKLNKLTSPSQVYVGSTIILPADEENPPLYSSAPIGTGQSSLENAILTASNPWITTSLNQKHFPSQILPGEPVFSNTEQNTSNLGSPVIQSINISPLPLVQGKTYVIRLQANSPVELSGSLNGVSLSFFAVDINEYVAIQGIHAMAQPGLAPLIITVHIPGEDNFFFEQAILLEPGYYPHDPVLYVDPITLEPENTKPEDDLVRSITSSATPEKYWSENFRHPVDEPICVRSWYGSRRAYNDGPFIYFHTGVDYGVCANLNIYAPAPGRIVFIGDLTVRGLSTIIDHGWGIYTGFWHQANTAVQVGDFVQTGQLVGEIGGSGRATGPHLHWEIWANSIQVEPLDWISTQFP
jgi:murein DD-endopeptidase MepM/ murein hydrolase activator NlpD